MNTNTRTFVLHLTEDELVALMDSVHAYKRSLVTDPHTRGIPETERERIESARAKVEAAFEHAYKENRRSPGRSCCSCAEVTLSLNPRFGTLDTLETADRAAAEVSWQLTGRRFGVPFKHADGRWYIRTSLSRALVIPTPPGGDAAGHASVHAGFVKLRADGGVVVKDAAGNELVHRYGRWHVENKQGELTAIPRPPSGDAASHAYNAETNTWHRAEEWLDSGGAA